MIKAEAINDEHFIENPLTQQEIEPLGFYLGLIIGQISNLNKSGTYITFYAEAVTVFPGGYHFSGEEVRLCRTYFGILNQRFICVLGEVLVGW